MYRHLHREHGVLKVLKDGVLKDLQISDFFLISLVFISLLTRGVIN